uniref:Uncharacterized protein n=1 Tax=Timema douglasi TaxID=61478 RepID=A0A7R8VJ59_TIMDO|nr:unnamed protein product [Timema douglasi]
MDAIRPIQAAGGKASIVGGATFACRKRNKLRPLTEPVSILNWYGLLEGYTNGNGLLSTEDMTANQDVVNGTGERFVSKSKKLFDKVAQRKMSHSQQHVKKITPNMRVLMPYI